MKNIKGTFIPLLLLTAAVAFVSCKKYADTSLPAAEINAGDSRTLTIDASKNLPVAKIGAGDYHYLMIDTDGNLWAWGDNFYGQLGDGSTTGRTSPVQIKAGTRFTAVSAKDTQSLAIDLSGALWEWGYLNTGIDYKGIQEDVLKTPMQVKAGTRFTQAAAGRMHSLAIDTDGNLYVWGYNQQGQFGDGITTDYYSRISSPVQIKAGTKFTQVMAETSLSFAIDESGSLWAWGGNSNGEFGDGTTKGSLVPIKVWPK
jgi:alpha-tubulin suppressor-like RCC1 family protein